MEVTEAGLGRFFEVMLPLLDERQRRVLMGATARMLGRGGTTRVAEASGMSRNTVIAGAKQVDSGVEPWDRVRAPGGGRPMLIDTQPGLLEALDELVWPETRGDPMSALRWTAKSTTNLAQALVAQGYQISADTVGRLLHSMGYRLQAPSKTVEGTQHPDRDGQFGYLNEQAAEHLAAGEPVISVDTKKKELVGNYHNRGREWQPTGEPDKVKTHDFVDPEMGKAIPYGVYDPGANEGWVSVGDDADTAAFAVEAIRRWWQTMGQPRYPAATRLLINADAGGSNGYRVRAWKVELARLAQQTGLEITVCHYPSGTSKWNRIEHRLFAFIANTTTAAGLRVRAELDQGHYPTGVKIPDRELAAIPLTRHHWHGEWNYTLHPQPLHE